MLREFPGKRRAPPCCAPFAPLSWTAKTEQFTTLSEEDCRRLDDLASLRRQHYEPRQDIIREGEHSPECQLVLAGLACRYKLLPDGGRQIMAFLAFGDLCDAEIFILKEMDHGICALGPCEVAAIPGEDVRRLLFDRPGIALALRWGTLQDEAVLRARIVDLGPRVARQRIARILYEVLVPHRMVDATADDSFDWPVTQTGLADATGLTTVQMNRTLQQLREEGLIAVEDRRVTVLDRAGLRDAAEFSPNYLHLDRATKDPRSAPGRRVEGLI